MGQLEVGGWGGWRLEGSGWSGSGRAWVGATPRVCVLTCACSRARLHARSHARLHERLHVRSQLCAPPVRAPVCVAHACVHACAGQQSGATRRCCCDLTCARSYVHACMQMHAHACVHRSAIRGHQAVLLRQREFWRGMLRTQHTVRAGCIVLYCIFACIFVCTMIVLHLCMHLWIYHLCIYICVLHSRPLPHACSTRYVRDALHQMQLPTRKWTAHAQMRRKRRAHTPPSAHASLLPPPARPHSHAASSLRSSTIYISDVNIRT